MRSDRPSTEIVCRTDSLGNGFTAAGRPLAAVVHPGVPQQLDGIIGLSFLNRFSYAIEPGRRILRLR